MEAKFEKWNPGTGQTWVVAVNRNRTGISFTVEEAREFALNIVYRAWPSERVESLIKEIRAEDLKIKMKEGV